MNFGIIGAGIVGTAIAIRLRQAGHYLVGVHSRSRRSYERFCTYLHHGERRPLEEWLPEADLLFITTQDGMIRAAAEELTRRGLYKEGQTWIHCSGSVSSRVMQVDKDLPINYLSLHPLQAFAGIDQAVELIPGTHFGIEGDREDIGLAIVTQLGGIPHQLDPQQKPLYHAGAVVASNYLVTLAGLAVQLFEEAGITNQEALESLLPLMKGALQNLENVGLPQALTGPIARGDVDVIRGHLEHMPAKIDPVYRALGLYTLDIGQKKMELNGGAYAKEVWEEMNSLMVKGTNEL
ncbi:MAG: Rossmann-like and DUF2520 domain-containing protein [Desulfitobacterium hafniense]|nr:Rossmann-like and DUF2520 domain-containing protein [Desulfitobacterium hafniense]